MRILRDFACKHGHVVERFIESETEFVECPECKENAYKVINYGTVMLSGLDPGFPSAWNKWAEVRESRHRQMAEKKRRE